MNIVNELNPRALDELRERELETLARLQAEALNPERLREDERDIDERRRIPGKLGVRW